LARWCVLVDPMDVQRFASMIAAAVAPWICRWLLCASCVVVSVRAKPALGAANAGTSNQRIAPIIVRGTE
jgi:hypothetical protein